jgi:hypothetical protein
VSGERGELDADLVREHIDLVVDRCEAIVQHGVLGVDGAQVVRFVLVVARAR